MMLSLNRDDFDALICDCDGTLVDSGALYFRSLQSVFATLNLPFEKEWYFARTGLTPFELFDVYRAELHAIPADNIFLSNEVTHLFQENLHTLEEITFVADIVRSLHGQMPMAVASNGQRPNVVGSLQAVKLFQFFDTVVTVDDVECGKPAPDIYLEAARRLHTQPSRCLVLEDSDEGLQAARAAGMQAIDVRPTLANATAVASAVALSQPG